MHIMALPPTETNLYIAKQRERHAALRRVVSATRTTCRPICTVHVQQVRWVMYDQQAEYESEEELVDNLKQWCYPLMKLTLMISCT